MTILWTENITMRFGGLIAVNDFNLQVEDGQIVALIGPNGAGKTTVFNMISGIYSPTCGEIFYRDENINGIRPDQVAAKGIARTFQNIRLFNNLTVIENVLIGMTMNAKKSLIAKMFRTRGAIAEEKALLRFAKELLEYSELEYYSDEIAANLPYGLQRRLEIARALATNPSLLLLDEPAAGMNPVETDELAHFILKIRAKYGLSILLIEHHMPFVMKIAENIYVLDYGNLIAQGPPEEIVENQVVIKEYLGEESSDVKNP